MHQFSQDGWITTGLFEEFEPWHYWCYIYIECYYPSVQVLLAAEHKMVVGFLVWDVS